MNIGTSIALKPSSSLSVESRRQSLIDAVVDLDGLLQSLKGSDVQDWTAKKVSLRTSRGEPLLSTHLEQRSPFARFRSLRTCRIVSWQEPPSCLP